MKKLFQLSPSQWETLVSAFSNISQAVILFSLAAFFVPEVVNLPHSFSKQFAIQTFLGGLIMLWGSVIIGKDRG